MHHTMDDEDSLDVLQQIMQLNILDSESHGSTSSEPRGHAIESTSMGVTKTKLNV
jgi:hypothetical protein